MSETTHVVLSSDGGIALRDDQEQIQVSGHLSKVISHDASVRFPSGVKAIMRGSADVLLFEEPNHMRQMMIRVDPQVAEDYCARHPDVVMKDVQGVHECIVPLPYVICVLALDEETVVGFDVFVRTHPIRSASDFLMCFPFEYDAELIIGKTLKDLDEMPDLLADSFWNQEFVCTHDAMDAIPEAVRTPWDMIGAAEQNPLWALSAPWTVAQTTLSPAMHGVIGDSSSGTGSVFNSLVRKVSQGNPKALLSQEGPLYSVSLGDWFVVNVGDTLRVRPGSVQDDDLSEGVEYIVNQLIRDESGKVFVWFDGLEKKVRLTLARFERVKKYTVTHLDSFTMGDEEFRVGSLLMRTPKGANYLKRDNIYEVTALRRDLLGDVEFQLESGGESLWVAIEVGGELTSLIERFKMKVVDGAVRYSGSTLAEKSWISLGFDFNNLARGTMLYVVSLRADEEGVYAVFEGDPSEHRVFTRKWILGWNNQPKMEITPRSVSIGKYSFAIKQGEYLLWKNHSDKNPIVPGYLYRPVAIRRTEGRGVHAADCELVLEGCNQTIPIIQKSLWVFEDEYVWARRSYRRSGLRLHAGMRFEVIKELNGSNFKLDVGTIVRLQAVIREKNLNVLVFENGMSVSLTPRLSEFLRPFGCRRTRFTKQGLSHLSKTQSATHLPHRGKVEWDGTGAYQEINNDPERAGSRGEITRSDGKWKEVYFYDRRTYIWVNEQNLSPHLLLEKRVFKPRNPVQSDQGSLVLLNDEVTPVPEVMLRAREHLKMISALNHTDALGNNLNIGDLVKVTERSFSSKTGVIYRSQVGQMALVVNKGHIGNFSTGRLFLWVLFDDAVQSAATTSTYGQEDLPSALWKSDFHSRIGLIYPEHTERLEGVVKEPVKQPLSLQEGGHVRLSRNQPRLLPGGVTSKEIGTLLSVGRHDRVVVQFPSCPAWNGYLDELTVVQEPSAPREDPDPPSE